MRMLLLATALAATGCAHLKDADTVCPEYRGIRCLTAPECSFDRARGCEVCQCSDKGLPTPKGL